MRSLIKLIFLETFSDFILRQLAAQKPMIHKFHKVFPSGDRIIMFTFQSLILLRARPPLLRKNSRINRFRKKNDLLMPQSKIFNEMWLRKHYRLINLIWKRGKNIFVAGKICFESPHILRDFGR